MSISRAHAKLLRTTCAALALALALASAVGPSGSRALSAHAATYSNPVFAKDYPDPMVLRAGAHDYYAYGTTTGWEIPHYHFPILHSTDLVHWTYVGDVFQQDPSWATGDYWAPDVLHRGGTYYAYYTGMRGSHCVAVATGSRPTGPFKTRNVIGCGDAKGSGYIDPHVFIDDNGTAYLYVSVDSPEHTISVIRLKPDLLHAAGPRRTLFGITQDWERGQKFSTVEGPFLVKRAHLYYLFYSGNDWNGDYAMGYASSRSPLGPFTKFAGNPILRGAKDILGPGGGSVVVGPDGRDWLVFHAWDDGGVQGYTSGGVRSLLIEPMTWHGDRVTVHQPTNRPQPAPRSS